MYPSEKSLVFILTRVVSRYRTELSQSFSKHGYPDITPDYWIVLEWLSEEDNISIGQLAKRTSKDNAAISRIIDGMERNDLVNRVSSSTDKRSYQIVMTKYARGIVEKLRAIEESVLITSTKGLNPIEIKELIRMLEHLHEKLE
jgi:DNA-binding MarR family transcriptional regulator